METVRAFDAAKIGLAPRDETDTMRDPGSEGRGLVAGAVMAAVFWTSLAACAWWLAA